MTSYNPEQKNPTSSRFATFGINRTNSCAQRIPATRFLPASLTFTEVSCLLTFSADSSVHASVLHTFAWFFPFFTFGSLAPVLPQRGAFLTSLLNLPISPCFPFSVSRVAHSSYLLGFLVYSVFPPTRASSVKINRSHLCLFTAESFLPRRVPGIQ